MLRSIHVDEVYTVPSLLQAQERTLKGGSKHPGFSSTLAPTCLVDFWMAHFSESSPTSQKWLLSVNFYSQTSKNFAQRVRIICWETMRNNMESHIQGSWWDKSTKEQNLGAICILCYSDLTLTSQIFEKNHPGAHWRQTPQTNEPEWQTQEKLCHIPILPKEPSQPGMPLNPGHGLQPREMTTKLRCVMVPSRGTETGDAAKAAFSVQISQIRHQNRLVKFYRAWSSKSTREFRDDLQPQVTAAPQRDPGPGQGLWWCFSF